MGLFKRKPKESQPAEAEAAAGTPESEADRVVYGSRDGPRRFKSDEVAHNLFSAGYLSHPFDDSWTVRDNRPCPAISWYRAAAEGGNTEAQFLLAYSYEHGIGTQRNMKEAIAWFSRASLAGSLKASYCLGCIYATDDTHRQYGKAYEAFERACIGGYAHAGLALYEMYAQGIGISDTNSYMGMKWLKEAASDGDPDALYALAHIMLYGGEYVHPDPYRARKLMEQAAFAGSVHGLASLGVMFLFGLGGRSPEPQVAFSVLSSAANMNSAVARNALGIMYAFGISVDRDPRKAFELIHSAAEIGDIASINNEAILHMAGYGAVKDRQLAADLLTKAAERGSSVALQNYSGLAAGGKPRFEVSVGNIDLSFDMGSDWVHRAKGADAGDKAGAPVAGAVRARPTCTGPGGREWESI